jgi:hypothetical protein
VENYSGLADFLLDPYERTTKNSIGVGGVPESQIDLNSRFLWDV